MVGRGSRKAPRFTRVKRMNAGNQGCKACRHAEPWPTIDQRLGAFNGLAMRANKDRQRLRYYDPTVREPRPTKCGPNLSPSSSFRLPRGWGFGLVQSHEHHLDGGVEAVLGGV